MQCNFGVYVLVPCHMADCSTFICSTYIDIHQTHDCHIYAIYGIDVQIGEDVCFLYII